MPPEIKSSVERGEMRCDDGIYERLCCKSIASAHTKVQEGDRNAAGVQAESNNNN